MELVKTLLVSIPKQFRWAARFETTVLNGTKMSTLPSGNYKPVKKQREEISFILVILSARNWMQSIHGLSKKCHLFYLYERERVNPGNPREYPSS